MCLKKINSSQECSQKGHGPQQFASQRENDLKFLLLNPDTLGYTPDPSHTKSKSLTSYQSTRKTKYKKNPFELFKKIFFTLFSFSLNQLPLKYHFSHYHSYLHTA
jgi:hypothetical protein